MVRYTSQLDRLHHPKKEGHAFLNFLTSSDTTGASEKIRECGSQNEYETSMKFKEACDRRQYGWICLLLAREGYRLYYQIKRKELFKKEHGKKALCKDRKVRRMSGSFFCSRHAISVPEQTAGSCFVSRTVETAVMHQRCRDSARTPFSLGGLVDGEEDSE